MQYPKCRLRSNAILARNPELHFFRVTLYSRSIGRTLKTEYTTNGGSKWVIQSTKTCRLLNASEMVLCTVWHRHSTNRQSHFFAVSVAAMTMGIVWNRMMGTSTPVHSAFPVRSAVSGSDMRSCPNLGHWKQRFLRTRTPNAAWSADRLLYQSPTGRNIARTVPLKFTGGRKQKVNGKGGQEWTIRGLKSQHLQGFLSTKLRWVVLVIIHLGKWGSNCPRIKYDKVYVYPSAGKGAELHEAAKLPVWSTNLSADFQWSEDTVRIYPA